MSRRKCLVFDWNGTLIEDKDEKRLFKYLLEKQILESLKTFKMGKYILLKRINKKLEKLYANVYDSHTDFSVIETVFDLYNKNVLNKMSIDKIEKYIEEYAEEACNRLDKRIFIPLRSKYNNKHLADITCIISSGYDNGIKTILQKASYNYMFDFIVANKLIDNIDGSKYFSLEILDNKLSILKYLLYQNAIPVSNAAYIGDSVLDVECLKFVGYPIVSYFADADFKEFCRDTIRATILELPQDFAEFLDFFLDIP